MNNPENEKPEARTAGCSSIVIRQASRVLTGGGDRVELLSSKQVLVKRRSLKPWSE
ncbi:hypothetical protein [Scytonema sp. NUACC21]